MIGWAKIVIRNPWGFPPEKLAADYLRWGGFTPAEMAEFQIAVEANELLDSLGL